jgi:translation initiation factor 5A
MPTKSISLSELRVGNYAMVQGFPCKVRNILKSAPSKHGHAKFRVIGNDIFTHQRKEGTFHDKIDVPLVEKKQAQIINIMPDTIQLMDNQTYETYDIPHPGEVKIKDQTITLAPGQTIEYLEFEGNRRIISVQ